MYGTFGFIARTHKRQVALLKEGTKIAVGSLGSCSKEDLPVPSHLGSCRCFFRGVADMGQKKREGQKTKTRNITDGELDQDVM